MESGKLILEGITAAALIGAMTEIVRNELKSAHQEPEVLLTREETAQYLKIGLSTLSRWVSKGAVVCYGIEGRKYFKKSELDASLEKLIV